MQNSINQKVIDFTATYCGAVPGTIDDSTTLESLGIVSEQDRIEYMMELEDSFNIQYQQGDGTGIVTVGDAVGLIMGKL